MGDANLESDLLLDLEPFGSAEAALEPGQGSDGKPLVTYYIKKTIYNKNFMSILQNLPEQFLMDLEHAKRESVCARDPFFHKGSVPVFSFPMSLSPTKTWYVEFRKYLQSNKMLWMAPRKKEGPKIEQQGIYKPKLLSNEKLDAVQTDFVSCIVQRLYTTESMTDIVILNGKAGTGKTTVLKKLVNLKKIKVDIHYLALSSMLCEDVKTRIFNGVAGHTHTICSFLMKELGLEFYDCLKLQEMLVHVPWNCFKFPLKMQSRVFAKYNLWNKFFYLIKHRVFIKKFIYFIDEYSLFTEGLIGFLIHLFRCMSQIFKVKIIIIFAGDENQIKALFQMKSSSLAFLKNEATATFLLEKQFRIEDHEYEMFLNKILKRENVHELLNQKFKFKKEIVYEYPYELIQNIPIGNERLIYEYIETKKIAKTCNFILFGFQNVEVQYNNIALTISIIEQLKKRDVKLDDIYKIIRFQVLLTRCRTGDVCTFPKIESPNGRLPILPLVVGFEYKILSRNIKDLPRSSIVLLVRIEYASLLVYSRKLKTFFEITNEVFNTNLIPGFKLYGFPIQMYASETSCSSQGLTLDKQLYANFSSNSIEEVYVILSRVKSFLNIESLYIPPPC